MYTAKLTATNLAQTTHVSPAHILWVGLARPNGARKPPVLLLQLWMLVASKMSGEGFAILWRLELQQTLGENVHAYLHGSRSAEVNKNINLGYSQDQITPSFKVRVCFRAILLCQILKMVLVAH